jgi:hypothetical protein
MTFQGSNSFLPSAVDLKIGDQNPSEMQNIKEAASN